MPYTVDLAVDLVGFVPLSVDFAIRPISDLEPLTSDLLPYTQSYPVVEEQVAIDAYCVRRCA